MSAYEVIHEIVYTLVPDVKISIWLPIGLLLEAVYLRQIWPRT